MDSNIEIKNVPNIISSSRPFNPGNLEWIGDFSKSYGLTLETSPHQEEVNPVPDKIIYLWEEIPDGMDIIYFRLETDKGDLIIELVLPSQQPINRVEDIDGLQHIVAVDRKIYYNDDPEAEELLDKVFGGLIETAVQTICQKLNEIEFE